LSTATKVAPILAIAGGKPVRTTPFAPWPFFAPDEIAVATEVLRSGKVNYWTGPQGSEFEKELAAAVGVEHAVAVANGTVALELALQVLGIGPGDEVVTASRTFIASASCAVMRGAIPVCADVDRDSQNVTAETVRAVLTPRTKAIIAVHLAGWPCDMDPILSLARERGLRVIEDCAQCHGATYKGRPLGSFGDINAFSFCQDKIITTAGEGGAVVTKDSGLWERAWSFKDHGKSYDSVYRRQHPPGFRWLHESFGTNWRLAEVQSAVGRLQLAKLPEWVATRRRYAEILSRHLSQFAALRVPQPAADVGHSYYKFYAFLRPERLLPGWTRDRVMQAIAAEGVPCFSGSCSEIYLEKAFDAVLQPPERLPVARELGETSLMFLVHPTLAKDDILDVCHAVEKVLLVAAS
jgi:dTDP-4-amino-4,6-dideoxygalactose transaminase